MEQHQIDSLHRLQAGGQIRLTISQDTFDETVKETMDDFEMSFEEALQEAIDQFNAQGVDLRNIQKDDPNTRCKESQGVEDACNTLREALKKTEESGFGKEAKVDALKAMKDLLSESQISDERRSMACSNGAVGGLVGVLVWMMQDEELVGASFETMTSLFKHDRNREALGKQGCMAIIANLGHHNNNVDLQVKGLTAARQAMVKFEHNKCTFDECGIIELVVKTLQQHSANASVCKHACAVMRQLVLRDDHSEQTDQCFDRARVLLEQKALKEACTVLSNFKQDETMVPMVLSTLACTAISKDNVDALTKAGALDLTIDTFRTHHDKPGIAKDASFLLGSMAQNDDQKKVIGQGDGVALIFGALTVHRTDAKVLAKAFKALSVLTLRMPENCTRIAETGGIPCLLDLMRAHSEKEDLQAHCCTIIRNLVSRNQELVPVILDEGGEELVRRAAVFPRCNELAFNALRDLHVKDLTFKEEWKGEIGMERKLEQGDGSVEDPDFKALVAQTKEEMSEATGLSRFAS